RPAAWVVAVAVGAVVALATLPFLGTSVVPSFKDKDVLVRLNAEPGTSNPRMTEITRDVATELRSIAGVDNVGAHVGRAITGDQIVDVNSSEVWVSLAADANYDEAMENINDAVRRVDGVDRDVATYTTQKIRDVGALADGEEPANRNDLDVLTGVDTPLVTRVYGQDPDVLRREAEKVQRAVAGVDGVVNARLQLPRQQPTLEIEVDLDRAQRAGIKPGDVRRAEATLLQGLQVGSVFEDQKVFDVIVQGTPETRESVEAVRNLLIDAPDGGQVRLGEVADVRVGSTATVIEREAVSRYVDIEAGVSGRGADAVAGDIRARLAAMSFPLEYHAEVFERSTGEELGAMTMLAFALAAAVAVLLLLQAAFRSWRLAAAVLLVVPVGLAGGLVAALIAGAELSLGSLLGLLAVFGVGLRTSVLLIRHLQDVHEVQPQFGPPVVQRAAGERLAPIVATTVALIGLALPFVVLGSRAGLEVVHPMAVVLVGGMLTSALVSLFVVPGLFLRLGSKPRPRIEVDGAVVEQYAGVAPEGAGYDTDPLATMDRPATPAAPAAEAPGAEAGARQNGGER
ncbi:MAG TPA: efflux RND transporter permease subunit, partial [Solirubrobacteraceae bacterium]|nr:efflux RND transporter permease subunit [Solirubrobacteraceae bacterium]